MKFFKYTLLMLLTLTALNTHSQTLRVTGYAGLVVFLDGSRFPVSGATLQECEDNFNDVAGEEELYEGKLGTQYCAPSFIYRSPTAPNGSLTPAEVIIPQLPMPPLCLSCPLFGYPELIKDMYPDHSQQVQGYVQQYKIDQYNQDLINLQNQYKSNLTGFEKKMFALEEALSGKDK